MPRSDRTQCRELFDDGAHGAQRCSRVRGHDGRHSTTAESRLHDEARDSSERSEARRARALEVARARYETDDVEVGDRVEWVDAGYWVAARVFVSADDAEPTA